MDVGHIISGRPWLYDMDVTIYGLSNSYFVCLWRKEDQVAQVAPLRLDSPPETKQTDASSSKKSLTQINLKITDKEIAKGLRLLFLLSEKLLMTPKSKFLLQLSWY